ncbi:MAG: WD40 repeat domain-containing protein [Planctomycetota bacterium]
MRSALNLSLLIFFGYASFSFGQTKSSSKVELQVSEHLDFITESVRSIGVSPNSSFLAVGTDAGFQLLPTDRLEPMQEIDKSQGSVVDLAFASNSKLLVTVGSQRYPCFWSLPDGKLLSKGDEKRWAWKVAAHPTELECLTTGGNPRICKWNMVSGRLMQEVETDFAFTTAIQMLPGGKQFVSCGTLTGPKQTHRYKLELRDYKSLKTVRVLQEAANQIYVIAISDDGKRLGFITQKGLAEIWDLATFKPIASMQFNQEKASGLVFLDDGRSALISGWHRKIVHWDFLDNSIQQLDYPISGGVTSMVWLRKAKSLVVGSGLGEKKLVTCLLDTIQKTRMPSPETNASLPTSGKGGRLDVPTGAALQAATERVKNVMDAQTTALSLLRIAKEESDKTVQYAVLKQVLELGVQEADQKSCQQAVTMLAATYVVPRLRLSGQVMRQAMAKGIPRKARLLWSAWSERLGDEAETGEKISYAVSFYHMAFELRAQSNEPAGAKAIKRKREELMLILPAYEEARDSLDLLTRDANNPEACRKAGYYLTFVRGKWNEGLPLLAKGDDPDLKALAKLDSATSAADVVEKGQDTGKIFEAWKKLSESTQDSQLKAAAIQAARFWLKKDISNKTGLELATLKKLLQELRSDFHERN